VFGLKPAATDEEILKRLFELYVEATGDLFRKACEVSVASFSCYSIAKRD
jgi:hypothetical protein